MNFEYNSLLGQSLANGGKGAPILTLTPPYPNELFEVHGRADSPIWGQPVPLHELHGLDKAAPDVERPSTALGRAIYEGGPPRNVIVTTHGIVGTGIKQLTGAATDEHLQRFGDCCNWAAANGHTVVFKDLHFIHGEADQKNVLAPSIYVTRLQNLRNKWDAGIRSVMASHGWEHPDWRIIQCQTDSWPQYLPAYPRIGLAQLEAHRAFPWYVLVGSKAHLRYATDGVHLKNTAYRHLGEMHGRATLPGHEPVHPWSIALDGAYVTIRVHTSSQLVLDISKGEVPNAGFRWHDSGDPADFSVPQTSVVGASVSGDMITLLLNQEPTGPGWISHGWVSRIVNVRDSSPIVSIYDGGTLQNWLCHFYDPIGYQGPPPV